MTTPVEVVHATLSGTASTVTCPSRGDASTPEWSAMEVQNLDDAISVGIRFRSGTAAMDGDETLTLTPGSVERRDWQTSFSAIAASGTPKIQVVGRDD